MNEKAGSTVGGVVATFLMGGL